MAIQVTQLLYNWYRIPLAALFDAEYPISGYVKSYVNTLRFIKCFFYQIK